MLEFVTETMDQNYFNQIAPESSLSLPGNRHKSNFLSYKKLY